MINEGWKGEEKSSAKQKFVIWTFKFAFCEMLDYFTFEKVDISLITQWI